MRLIEPGQTEEYLHFINKGLLRKFFYKGTQEVITQLAREGELICSSVSFFSGQPSAYAVETIEPSILLSLPQKELEGLYSRYPRMESLGRLLITDLFLQKEYWELDRIRYDTKERFVRFVLENTDLFRRVPQKYLASYLNIKPETFSRLKHHLSKRIAETSAPH
ncbi:Crp/Fnr family transcriptional regulator [Paraflavitalea speifideaquila]|uniref:Crp/Fnr family transcriptional regulator n=1 Tax=Paraflavitalea speifideaquila TaxID=3076558 RepID=UPI0028F0471B|nr:Crp/Fnr family transcriptional regulator [Paraflavitalea speifideiaquila]